MAQTNPPWTRDEVILALDTYFNVDVGKVSKHGPEVKGLSDILNKLPIHSIRPDQDRFRNPNGVYMKLMNLRAIDPDYDGAGLSSSSKVDRAVFDEFGGKREELRLVAEVIRTEADDGAVEKVIALADNEDEFAEGKLLTRAHKLRERNPSAATAKKAQVKASHGCLKCEVCGFDFEAVYGDLGEGFIECHHVVPLSECKAETKTRLSDLVLVCANCHRMLHRSKSWMNAKELRQLMNSE